MCSTELLLWKNQNDSTCYHMTLFKRVSTADIFLFLDKLFHKTESNHRLWRVFICLECQMIIVFVANRKSE